MLNVVLGLLGLVIVLVGVLLAVLYAQGQRSPDTNGQYVALGSSFAAGIGQGERAPGSPLVCMRTTSGYPSILAAKLGLSLVDMSCSGSTTSHILKGGQVFLGPQLDAVGPLTQLVTITSGGNDVGYIGDLMNASGRGGLLTRLLVGKSEPIEARPFEQVTDNFVAIVAEVRRRAPAARIVLVSYPNILQPGEPCAALGIGPDAAALSREVGSRLAAATRIAAERSGAVLVDMAPLSTGHEVCSTAPWILGAKPATGTAFHPNAAGAKAVADAVFATLARPLSLSPGLQE